MAKRPCARQCFVWRPISKMAARPRLFQSFRDISKEDGATSLPPLWISLMPIQKRLITVSQTAGQHLETGSPSPDISPTCSASLRCGALESKRSATCVNLPATPFTPMDPSTSKPPPTRLTSLDAYRGFVMFLMAAEVLHLSRIARALPESGFWKFLACHQAHVEWVGCSLHDLIQPSFRPHLAPSVGLLATNACTTVSS